MVGSIPYNRTFSYIFLNKGKNYKVYLHHLSHLLQILNQQTIIPHHFVWVCMSGWRFRVVGFVTSDLTILWSHLTPLPLWEDCANILTSHNLSPRYIQLSVGKGKMPLLVPIHSLWWALVLITITLYLSSGYNSYLWRWLISNCINFNLRSSKVWRVDNTSRAMQKGLYSDPNPLCWILSFSLN